MSSRQQLKKRSIIPNGLVQYKSTIDFYKDFLNSFEQRMKIIIQKQSYRIYLEDKVNQKKYKQLMQQQQQLLIDIQNSKDYTLSMNRGLIEQIINLDKLKQEYGQVFKNYSSKISQNKNKISQMQTQIKQLQRIIKSYWIYEYDLIKFKQNQNSPKSTYSKNALLNNDQHALTPSLFPSLQKKYTNYFQARDKSIVNSSKNKQKIINRINNINSQVIKQKLEYEKEKITLMKLFSYKLKDFSNQSDQELKYKIASILNQLNDEIKRKEAIIDQIIRILS